MIVLTAWGGRTGLQTITLNSLTFDSCIFNNKMAQSTENVKTEQFYIHSLSYCKVILDNNYFLSYVSLVLLIFPDTSN